MNKFTKYPALYEPIKIGKLTAKNRIEVPPMGPKLGAVDYRVTEQQMSFFEQRAKSGAGIVTIPDTSVDYETGTTLAQGYYINGEKSISELKKLTHLIHRYGALASIELNHGGWEANAIPGPAYCVSEVPAELSILPEFQNKGSLKLMTEEDIQRVIGKYAEAAAICKAAGFDMVMVHCAHGSLPAQFISPQGNRRTDRYGGSAEKRMTFMIELFSAIKAAVGEDFPVEARVSGIEYEENGLKTEDVISYLKVVQKHIDLVHVSSGFGASMQALSPYYFPRNVHVEAAAKIKQALDIPVNVVSAIATLENANDLIASKKVDMVAMGRSSLADEDIFVKGARGLTDAEIRPCVRCSRCQSNVSVLEPIGCTVNPLVGNEYTYAHRGKADKSKKVVIVGGGPAGMQAARTAVQRGHEVVLFEKRDSLGGMLETLCSQSFKGEFKRYMDWAIQTTMNCGADIRLGISVTSETIRSENPDAVILAIGGEPITLKAFPIDHQKVVTVEEVDLGKVAIGKKVLVAGGGVSGVECAMELADQGKEVTVADLKPIQGWAGVQPLYFFLRMALLKQKGVQVLPETGIVEITPNGAITSGGNGEQKEIEADTIVLAVGNRPNNSLIDELSAVCPETYIIGNAEKDGDVYRATHSAFYAAMEL